MPRIAAWGPDIIAGGFDLLEIALQSGKGAVPPKADPLQIQKRSRPERLQKSFASGRRGDRGG